MTDKWASYQQSQNALFTVEFCVLNDGDGHLIFKSPFAARVDHFSTCARTTTHGRRTGPYQHIRHDDDDDSDVFDFPYPRRRGRVPVAFVAHM